MAKFSSGGTPMWAIAIGDSGARDIGRAITQDSNGDYVIVGYTDSPGNRDIVVARISNSGALLASIRVGSSREDYPWEIVDNPEDSSYVISGWTRGFSGTGKADLLIFKINYHLTFAWGKVLRAPVGTNSEASTSLIKTTTGDFMVAGFAENFTTPGSDTDVLFAQFGNDLGFRWAKIWNEYSSCFTPDKLDEVAAITEVQNNGWHGFAATGRSKSINPYSKEDIFITSFNENSKTCFQDIEPTIMDTTLAISDYGWAKPVELIQDSVMALRVFPEDSLICPCAPTGVDWKEGEEQYPDEFDIMDNYPNPFNPTTTINYTLRKSGNVKLTIYNSLGQVVATLVDKFQSGGTHQVTWAAKNQPSGVYFYQLKFERELLATKKMLLIR
ncbi:hypothetical protein B6D60_11250 [candidate division KSB1 bacterium 4484_87]|nr:MAG: hypothetical protein B6D60_11250 [candidate division KSB1 bacterium 4484_87]